MAPNPINNHSEPASVSVENVNLSFGKTHVLKDVSLQIASGEFFVFLGPSGSGKTTLMRLVAGFNRCQTGVVRIGGQDVTNLPPAKRNVGMVFQNYALWPHMTVRKNVAFGLEERRLPKAEIKERVDAALELVGLLSLAERRPVQLSGGQQQRVALARTVVVRPRVLLLDEPLSNLDAKLREQMRLELKDLQRRLEITTIFVTHDQEEANTIGDRLAVLDNGIIQQVGAPIELYDRPANRFVANFLGTANLLDGVVTKHDGEVFFQVEQGPRIPLVGLHQIDSAKSIMFRPQNLIIKEAAAQAPENRIALHGEVEYKEFLGSFIRYGVRVGGHRVLVDDSHQFGQPHFDPGARVALFLALDQATVL